MPMKCINTMKESSKMLCEEIQDMIDEYITYFKPTDTIWQSVQYIN
jgi:hypothetical protein